MATRDDLPPSRSAKPIDPPPASGRPTTAQLKGDIDSGRPGHKGGVFDPALAPPGTDDEAAGAPPSREAIAMARRQERGGPAGGGGDAPQGGPRVVLYGFIAFIAVLALAFAGGVLVGWPAAGLQSGDGAPAFVAARGHETEPRARRAGPEIDLDHLAFAAAKRQAVAHLGAKRARLVEIGRRHYVRDAAVAGVQERRQDAELDTLVERRVAGREAQRQTILNLNPAHAAPLVARSSAEPWKARKLPARPPVARSRSGGGSETYPRHSRVRPGMRSAVEHRRVFGMARRVAGHELAFRDDARASSPQRLEDAARELRADALAGKLCRHLGVEKDDAAAIGLVVGDRERVADGHLEPVLRGIVDDIDHGTAPVARRVHPSAPVNCGINRRARLGNACKAA